MNNTYFTMVLDFLTKRETLSSFLLLGSIIGLCNFLIFFLQKDFRNHEEKKESNNESTQESENKNEDTIALLDRISNLENILEKLQDKRDELIRDIEKIEQVKELLKSLRNKVQGQN